MPAVNRPPFGTLLRVGKPAEGCKVTGASAPWAAVPGTSRATIAGHSGTSAAFSVRVHWSGLRAATGGTITLVGEHTTATAGVAPTHVAAGEGQRGVEAGVGVVTEEVVTEEVAVGDMAEEVEEAGTVRKVALTLAELHHPF